MNIGKIVYDNLRIGCRAGDVFFNPFQIILLNAKKQLVTRCSDSHCHWINFDSDTIQRFHELTGLCFLFMSPLMITSGVFLTFLIFMPSAKNEKKTRNLEEGLLPAEKCHTNLASYTVDLKENNQNTLSSIRWQDTSWPRLLKRTRRMQFKNCETNDDTSYLVK